jgi:hypothetical protein
MNSISADQSVTRQPARLYVTAKSQNLTSKDCASCSDQSARCGIASLVAPKPKCAGQKWNHAANRVFIDIRCLKMILPCDADRG